MAWVIQVELAKSQNLQAYVSRSFDDWARDIGLDPPSERQILPVIHR